MYKKRSALYLITVCTCCLFMCVSAASASSIGGNVGHYSDRQGNFFDVNSLFSAVGNTVTSVLSTIGLAPKQQTVSVSNIEAESGTTDRSVPPVQAAPPLATPEAGQNQTPVETETGHPDSRTGLVSGIDTSKETPRHDIIQSVTAPPSTTPMKPVPKVTISINVTQTITQQKTIPPVGIKK